MVALPARFLKRDELHMDDGTEEGVPMKGGSFSISTFSVITKRLLRCLRGGFPTIGMVSFGPERSRLRAVFLGGVARPGARSGCREVRSMGSEAGSGLTTTIGGAAVDLSGAG